MILSILSKLSLEYAVFVSTFHKMRFTSRETWKIPSLDLFIESLTHEKDNLIKMGEIKRSKVHALVFHESNKSNPKTKQKGKGKKDPKQRKDSNFKVLDDSSSSKGGKGKQGKTKCGYCNHGYHPESSCMKKTIDLMESRAPTWKFQECLACFETFCESNLYLSNNTFKHRKKGGNHIGFHDHI
jgi:hypothetical protein